MTAPPSMPGTPEPAVDVAHLVGFGANVVVVGDDEAVMQALSASGCTARSLTPRALAGGDAGDAPDVVVLADAGGTAGELGQRLDLLRQRWPAAAVVLHVYNAASGTGVLRLLTGEALPSGALPDVQVQATLEAHGYAVEQRVARAWSEPLKLAGDTTAALRQLFSQVNEASQDGRVLYRARQGDVPARQALEPGLLSVVMRNHSLDRLELVDAAVFSLACQNWQPLELVVVTQSTDPQAVPRLEAVLERHRAVGQYRSQVIAQPSTDDIRARLVNVGAERARGQYLAVVDDDDVVYPDHYTRLIEALEASDRAWAFSRTRRAYFTRGADGSLYCRSKDYLPGSEAFDLRALLHDNYITTHSYVLDRERLATFRFGFEERLSRSEDYVFLLRLMALFRPLAMGHRATCEYRIRDDGSNSIPQSTGDQTLRAARQAQWNEAIHLMRQLRAPLQVLLTAGEFLHEVDKPRDEEPSLPPPGPLRHRLADALNDGLKGGVPLLHRALKLLAGRGSEPE